MNTKGCKGGRGEGYISGVDPGLRVADFIFSPTISLPRLTTDSGLPICRDVRRNCINDVFGCLLHLFCRRLPHCLSWAKQMHVLKMIDPHEKVRAIFLLFGNCLCSKHIATHMTTGLFDGSELGLEPHWDHICPPVGIGPFFSG